MDDLGNILYVIIFLVISILSAIGDKKKKKQKKKTPKPAASKPKPASSMPKPVEAKKEKSPLELLEDMFNDVEPEPEPVYTPPVYEYKPEPVVTVEKQETKIDLPKKKSYIRKSKYSVNGNYLRNKLRDPDTIRDLVVTSEILGKPKALQD